MPPRSRGNLKDRPGVGVGCGPGWGRGLAAAMAASRTILWVSGPVPVRRRASLLQVGGPTTSRSPKAQQRSRLLDAGHHPWVDAGAPRSVLDLHLTLGAP